MKTIILAGGMGIRLRNVVSDIPKPMAPVGGKPFLEYVIVMLAAQGLREIVLSVGYKKEVIQSHFEDGSHWKVKIVYSEEHVPLGTGGALREALEIAGQRDCLVLNGDTFNKLNFQNMIDFHNSKKALMTVGLMLKKNAGRYGSVNIDASGKVIGFLEKNLHGNGYINRGAYVASRAVLAHMPPGRFSLENDLFPKLTGLGFFGFVAHDFFIDMGIPSTYSYIDDHAHILETK